MRLFSPGFLPDDVFAHPRHEAAQKALRDLIVQLRAAANVKDGYELQQELIGHVRETEKARNAFSKAVKRIQDGKSPQLDAPEPQSGRDPSLLETWQFEHGVCERVARQLRCVGDALAWRVFGFERRKVSLARLQRPVQRGPAVVKAHMKNIYAKLGVSTRAETVERARLLGLLLPATPHPFPLLQLGLGWYPEDPAPASAPYLGVAGSPPTELDWRHGASQDTDQEQDNFRAAASRWQTDCRFGR